MDTAISDEWILEHLPGTCPEMAIEWMKETGQHFTDALYATIKNRLQRHVKSMERYGIVEYRYEVKEGAKIWHIKEKRDCVLS